MKDSYQGLASAMAKAAQRQAALAAEAPHCAAAEAGFKLRAELAHLKMPRYECFFKLHHYPAGSSLCSDYLARIV
jgi:hypothetical protein